MFLSESYPVCEPELVLSSAQLAQIVPLSRTQIWRLEQTGEFPKRIRIGRRRIGWRASEVYGWIAKCAVNQASARSKHQLDASRGR